MTDLELKQAVEAELELRNLPLVPAPELIPAEEGIEFVQDEELDEPTELAV